MPPAMWLEIRACVRLLGGEGRGKHAHVGGVGRRPKQILERRHRRSRVPEADLVHKFPRVRVGDRADIFGIQLGTEVEVLPVASVAAQRGGIAGESGEGYDRRFTRGTRRDDNGGDGPLFEALART